MDNHLVRVMGLLVRLSLQTVYKSHHPTPVPSNTYMN